MTLPNILLLFFAAILGGTLNAVAGGGSFFTFPSLVFAGIASKMANATNTMALWPGSAASVVANYHELMRQRSPLLVLLTITSLIGGTIGALLLTSTPQSTFVHLIPYLLLLATLLFAFSEPTTAFLRERTTSKKSSSSRSVVGVSVAQLVIAVYGGYFGGGIGILMLASLAMMGMDNIHEMNALKTLLATCMNGAAAIMFIVLGLITWPQAIIMIIGGIIGGYAGAHYARKINPKWVRLFVIAVGLLLTIWFFIKP